MKHRLHSFGSSVLRVAVISVTSMAVVGVVFSVGLRKAGAANTPSTVDTDWTYVDHDFSGTRYSPLTEITPRNASQLTKVCSYTFPEKVSSESAPIVSAGVLYATSDHYTVALDAADCHVLWTHQWTPRSHDSPHPHRGAAFANGRIIRGTGDDYLIALDAESGKLLWATQIEDSNNGSFVAMPPLVYGGLIYIGPAGSERAGNGWVGAFRLSDGQPVWKFHIIPQDGEPGADTWGPDPEVRKHAGGALWNPISYDTEKGLLYVNGGNPAPDFYDDARPGTNLYTNSIIALDGKTGKMVWYHQIIPHDVDDYDITHVNPIFKAGSRNLVAATGKDGILHVIDRDTHKSVYNSPFATQFNAEVPLTNTPMKVCPGILGGDEWNSGAFSPKLSLLIIPANDGWCSMNSKDKEPPSIEAAEAAKVSYFGGPIDHGAFSEARGRVTGFDAATGKERWRYEAPTPVVAGVAVTASNVIFTGETGGFFDALDAQSGKVLLHYDLGDSIQGGVITYSAHRSQYVAVISGDGNVIGHKNFPEIKGGNPMVTIFGLPKK